MCLHREKFCKLCEQVYQTRSVYTFVTVCRQTIAVDNWIFLGVNIYSSVTEAVGSMGSVVKTYKVWDSQNLSTNHHISVFFYYTNDLSRSFSFEIKLPVHIEA